MGRCICNRTVNRLSIQPLPLTSFACQLTLVLFLALKLVVLLEEELPGTSFLTLCVRTLVDRTGLLLTTGMTATRSAASL